MLVIVSENASRKVLEGGRRGEEGEDEEAL